MMCMQINRENSNLLYQNLVTLDLDDLCLNQLVRGIFAHHGSPNGKLINLTFTVVSRHLNQSVGVGILVSWLRGG